MRLLFDQNLSFKLCQHLSDIFPQSTQARIIGMDQDSDHHLWDYAKQNEYAIVTQDGDYSDLSCIYGWPPKVIWLRCGNRATGYIEHLLRSHADEMVWFLRDPSSGVLEIP